MPMRHLFPRALLLAVLVAAGPACDGLVDPSDNVITEFTGVLQPGSANEHQIDIRRSGEFSLRVRSLDPSAGIFVGINMGLVDQGFCALLYQQFAGHNQLALAGPMNNFTYCIQVIDVGVLTEPVSYVLELSHP